jgi:hypothetical protein
VAADVLVVRQREKASRADELRQHGVPGRDIPQIELEVGDPDVFGDGGGQERAHPRPGAVGADQEFGRSGAAVGEGQGGTTLPSMTVAKSARSLVLFVDRWTPPG